MKLLSPSNVTICSITLLFVFLCFANFSFADCAGDCSAAYNAATQTCATAQAVANQACDNSRNQAYISAANEQDAAEHECNVNYGVAIYQCQQTAIIERRRCGVARDLCAKNFEKKIDEIDKLFLAIPPVLTPEEFNALSKGGTHFWLG